MNAFRFLANDAADAVRQIRAQLGPEAVVVSVNPLPAQGVGRLWRKPRLEVVACLPDGASPNSQPTSTGLEASVAAPLFPPEAPPANPPPRPQPVAIAAQAVAPEHHLDCLVGDAPEPEPWTTPVRTAPALPASPPGPRTSPLPFQPSRMETAEPSPAPPPGLGGTWRSSSLVLHQMGLQPLYVESVLERARAHQGDAPPASFAQELACVRSALASFWHPLPAEPSGVPALHVFIGPPGSGKTTVLCKWLAKLVLGEGRPVRAWRLDGRSAHFPGLLDFYGEILGVSVEREWAEAPGLSGYEVGFIDLPGASILDKEAVGALRTAIAAIPQAQVHLVLNAAYDISLLMAQARCFSALPVTDLIWTHLDEEKKRGKLWNLVIGTNFAVRFLSGGQNVPGDFQPARPESLFPK